MQKPIFLVVCLSMCLQATLSSSGEDHGFLSNYRGSGSSSPFFAANALINESEEGLITIVQPVEVLLTEDQIENRAEGCFTKYAYGNNVKDFGLSSASISCPSPDKYKLTQAECSFVGNGRRIGDYSHNNFHYCATQGAKRGEYHRTVVNIRCCSI